VCRQSEVVRGHYADNHLDPLRDQLSRYAASPRGRDEALRVGPRWTSDLIVTFSSPSCRGVIREVAKHPSGIKPESWLISAGRTSEPGTPLNVPLVPASNFIIGSGREYSRDDGTPTWEALEEVVGGLESGKAVAFASGMAAIASVFDQLAAGAVVVLPDDCYQGVAGLAVAGAARGRWSLQRVAVDDTAGWISACSVADLIWLESPSNPLLTVADLEAICAAPRKPGAILAVDNTFATPLNQQPLDFGASVSLQSATKFIGGHSDLLAGIATTKDDALWHALRKSRELTGATPGTLEAFLAVRGARTLALRLQRAQQTAMMLSERIESHPQVARVRYPGLLSHPTHAIARRVLKGFGTIISFDLRGGAEIADRVCRTVTLIRHATSLGAVESTIERRAAIPGQGHLPPSLLRLSVGIEDVDDLWADLDSAICSAAL
jgi:cystathionine gamma-synthase